MKILIINMYYYPNMIGGAEHSVKLLAETLANQGNDVFIYSLDGSDASRTFIPEIINGVKVYRGYSESIYRRRIKKEKYFIDKIRNGLLSIYNRKACKDIIFLLNTIQPDVVHTNNLVSISYNCWKIFRKFGINTVHTLRDYWLLDPTTVIGKSSPVISTIFRVVTKKYSNDFKGVITAPSSAVITNFKERSYFNNTSYTVIPNAINIDVSTLKKNISEKQHRNDVCVRFLYAGYLSDNKGIINLLNAFRMIEDKSIKLIICGNGPLEQIVRRCESSDKRIEYKGNLGKQELAIEYQKSDVLIVPSLWDEPFGRIVIEGAYHGDVVIGSDRGGIPEIIDKLKNGEVINPDNVVELSETIRRFSDRKYFESYLGNIETNIFYYSSEKQANSFLKIYKSKREETQN